MISTFMGSFLRGVLLILVLDFILFSGVMGNYFTLLEIKEYFNPIFVDNQIYSLILLLAFPIGYMFVYKPYSSFFTKIYLALLLIFSLTFIEEVGFSVGEFIFSKKASISVNNKDLEGKILYIGREYLYFREDLSDKTLKFEKELVIC